MDTLRNIIVESINVYISDEPHRLCATPNPHVCKGMQQLIIKINECELLGFSCYLFVSMLYNFVHFFEDSNSPGDTIVWLG